MSALVAEKETKRAAAPTGAGPVLARVSESEAARARAMHSFRYTHSLAGNPLLSAENVRKLTEKLVEQKRYNQLYFRSNAPGSERRYYDDTAAAELAGVFDHIQTSDAWVRLTRVDEISPEFGEIARQFAEDLSELHGINIPSKIMKTFVTVFLSSPGTVTHYHMDHTWNYLNQIQGSKTVYLYDPFDSDVISQKDVEDWYMRGASIVKKKDTPMAYELAPGDGVHHPVNAPHWVQNGPEMSVSLSLGLCLTQANRDAKVHQVNHLLRKAGLNPPRPRPNAWQDTMKASFMDALSDKNSSDFDAVVFSGRNRIMGALRAGKNVVRGLTGKRREAAPDKPAGAIIEQ